MVSGAALTITTVPPSLLAVTPPLPASANVGDVAVFLLLLLSWVNVSLGGVENACMYACVCVCVCVCESDSLSFPVLVMLDTPTRASHITSKP